MRIGRVRKVDRDADAATRGGRVVLVGRRFDRGPQVVRSQVQQDETRVELRELEQVLGEPVEALDLARARLEELGARLRDRRRPSPCSSWLNVRSAASGVRSSCETSARKSRLRSRSRRLISTLSSRRSAIVLNWTASSPSSVEPARNWAAGTRRDRSPSASARDASVSWRSGVVKRRVSAADTTTARPSANRAIAARRPVRFAMAEARKVDGLASVISSV